MTSNNNHKVLFLFTDKYPFGKTQESYIDNEIGYLTKVFRKVILIPVDSSGIPRANIPGSEILNIHELVKANKWKLVFYVNLILKFLIVEKQNSKSAGLVFNIRKIFNAINYSEAIELYMRKNNLKESDVVLYSYWFYHWSFVCSVFKYKHSSVKAFSRAHLNDLYGEFNNDLFTISKLKYLDKIFPISNHGKHYLESHFKQYHSKIETRYLGVNNLGVNEVVYDSEKFVIVSCSAIRTEKRVEKIVETLSYINFQVLWIHFGDGPCMDLIKEACKKLPKNITVDLKGFVPNNLVKEYYLNNQINLFLNFSSAEGLPVSIMEIISFGIPVMATAIYGTPEAVPDQVGILIDKDFEARDVANKITEFKNSGKNTATFRAGVRRFWETNFCAETNYTKFSKELCS